MNLQHLIDLDQHLTLALNGSNSLFWDGAMMAITSTLTWLPVAVVLIYIIIKNNSMEEIFLILGMIALTIVVADQFSSSFCKPFFARFRPTQDPALMYSIDVVNNYRSGMYGFISGHASNTFSLAMLFALLLRYKRFTILVFVWAALCSFSRIYLGVHYVGDILCGTLWGLTNGTCMYLLFRFLRKKIYSEPKLISSKYTAGGYLKADVNLLLAALMLTYIGICFWAILYQ